EITSNPLVRTITFTGSTAVGKILLEQCSKTVKKTSMELGGNAPFIVFDDADLDAAVEGALASKYRNTGQTCVCANRLLVQDKVYYAYAAKLNEKVKAMKVGNCMEPCVVQGPLIDKAAVEKVEEHISDALSKGAKLLTGGKRHALGGTFFEPTVLANVNTSMKVTREETFGPVAPLFRFKDEKEAIRLANDTEFGLASYFYGRDVNRVWRVAEALEYGIVGIKTGIISTEVAPFGGVTESGMGLGVPGGTPSISSIPSIALDAANDRLFAATQQSVVVFDNASTANGNASFSRSFTATVITDGITVRGVNFYGLSLDTTNNRLY